MRQDDRQQHFRRRARAQLHRYTIADMILCGWRYRAAARLAGHAVACVDCRVGMHRYHQSPLHQRRGLRAAVTVQLGELRVVICRIRVAICRIGIVVCTIGIGVLDGGDASSQLAAALFCFLVAVLPTDR